MNAEDRRVSEPWVKLYEPGARENAVNLPESYYDDLAKTMPMDQRQRFIEGVWGTTFTGKPVYREFNYDIHCKDLQWLGPDVPLMRFHDFGYRRPYTVLGAV
jgi:hypothetical protein